jgi:hypothetical protein
LKLLELGGDIYAIGGVDAGFTPLDAVERYDPGRDAWATLAPMLTRRANPGVAVVGNEIVVVGGGTGVSLDTSEVYNRQENRWELLEPLLEPGRSSLISANAGGATILAIGGFIDADGGSFVVTPRVDGLLLRGSRTRPQRRPMASRR